MYDRAGPAIEATGLAKTYGSGDKAVRALAGVSFTVPAGTVFGLLGPNGAGKSTIVKTLTTLAHADSGHATVAGVDVARDPVSVRRRIGYVPQKPSFDPTATGRENLLLQGRIHGLSGSELRSRADELLERFGLSDAADRLAKKWSGGMQRKLDVALGLIHRPEVLFLDEPTTGLDPEARSEMWDEISGLKSDHGITVLLTTQYLDEADQLADRIAVIDHGRVIAEGTSGDLKASVGAGSLHVRVHDLARREEAARLLGQALATEVQFESDPSALSARIEDSERVAVALAELTRAGVSVSQFALGQPSLDEVFLALTGHPAEAADDTAKEAAA